MGITAISYVKISEWQIKFIPFHNSDGNMFFLFVELWHFKNIDTKQQKLTVLPM